MRNPDIFDSIAVSGKPWLWHQQNIHKGYVKVMLQNLSDGELIKRYLQDNSEQAFKELIDRHYNNTKRRFFNHCHNAADAADLTQQLWIRVVNNLDSYHDDGRFASFLNRISTNLLTDHWRRKGVKSKVISESQESDDDIDVISQTPATNADIENNCDNQQQVDYLVKKLIPALPCDQRLVFLLRHESEYWEEKQRLEWNHIAELNGIDKQTAWSRFEQARNSLITHLNSDDKSSSVDLDSESLLIFFVWTQAQRLSKQQEFTWDYFAKLLNVSTNTLKTRYRAAMKKLGEGLSTQH
ncbi:MAG TPA: sigma-70 family RNA polymerase sigma factor [Gammaproteobacteria bacterium]|nr:sigma-70 family RNA polymerase sigma factor [Gammaproteobacteria bacterium]